MVLEPPGGEPAALAAGFLASGGNERRRWATNPATDGAVKNSTLAQSVSEGKLPPSLTLRASISRRCVLKSAGIETGPERGEGTWASFIKRHAATLWACDFMSVKTWTKKGLVDVFVLFFIHIGSRRVHLAGMTTNPDTAWVGQQAGEVATFFAGQTVKTSHLIRDRDSKFGQAFDADFESQGITVVKVGPKCPNMNAHAERWIRSARAECLDHFIVFGETHLLHLLNEYILHYNTERAHQGVGNRPLDEADAAASSLPFTGEKVLCRQRLGGLLRHYSRQQAA